MVHVSSSKVMLLLGAAALVTGCGDNDVPTGVRNAGLTRAGSCEGLSELLRQRGLREMEAELGANLANDLRWHGIEDDVLEDAPNPTAGGNGSGGGRGPSESSGTNNQVAGVDEADLVKNRDGNLFVTNGNKLRIIDAWPAASMHVVSETAIEGEARKLFLVGDRAVVYSALGVNGTGDPRLGELPLGECTYGYTCAFTGDGRATKITVLDISNLAAPRVERTIRLSGSLIAARLIDGTVHSVVSDARTSHGMPVRPADLGNSPLAITMAYGKLLAENRKNLMVGDASRFVPSAEDSVQGQLASCESFYRDDATSGLAVTSVLSLEPSGTASFSSILSRPGAVYASASSLYMAVPSERVYGEPWFFDAEDQSEVTTVHRFGLQARPALAEYRGSGLVTGRVLNQLAMDEHDGVLRIATTTGHAPSPTAHSTMTTLAVRDDGLERLGIVDDIAPSEDIRAVRFAGRRGYVVTFKKTDPLYVFDLDPPQAPRILSELKIPGFSTYLHPLDDDHLLSVGYDADDQGSFAFFSGVLLQIFDVSDPTRPVLRHRERIGTRGSSSEALTNHLAFTYFAPKQALALPMTLCQSGGVGQAGTMSFSGLMVFHAAAADGFAETGRVPHPPGEDINCYNWWTDARSQVRRTVFMDDYVYSISGSLVKANALGNLAAEVAQVRIDQ